MGDVVDEVFLVVAAVITLVGIGGVLLAGTRVYGRDIHWLAGRPVTEQEADVLARYLRRHRVHRVVGGFTGVGFALVVSLRTGGPGLAIGDDPAADLLFCGVAGVIVGALSAESYRLRFPRSTPVAASLAPRPALPLRREVVAAWALVVIGLAAAVPGAVDGNLLGLRAAVFGAAVLAAGAATRSAIANRRRPVLSERALELDGRMRGFASASVARLQVSMGAMVVVWSIWAIPDLSGTPAGFLAAVASLGGLFVAIRYLRRAAPRPPKYWGATTLPRTAPA